MAKFFKTGILLSIVVVASVVWAAPIPTAISKKAALGANLPEGEKAIYLRIVEAFRRGDIKETYKFRDMLVKNYPKSIYGDNAFYLAGLLDYQRGRVAEAVKNFGEVVKRYPHGNKRAAALYAKSMAYSKLNLPHISKKLLEEITKIYPGIPESQMAWIDLRLKDGRG